MAAAKRNGAKNKAPRDRVDEVMNVFRFPAVRPALAMLALFLGGCAGRPGSSPPAATAGGTGVAKDEAVIEITSLPSRAPVLVNDRPVGHTPYRLAVKVTAQEFCVDYLSIKVRFVAQNPSEISKTIETSLTPREKAPRALLFTPDGVQRRLR